ncbi:hypothetical protein QJQ45_020852, partial [Haematococcus lacustris]
MWAQTRQLRQLRQLGLLTIEPAVGSYATAACSTQVQLTHQWEPQSATTSLQNWQLGQLPWAWPCTYPRPTETGPLCADMQRLQGTSLPSHRTFSVLRPQPASRQFALQLKCPPVTALAGTRPKVDIDWDTLGFGLQNVAANMYVANWTEEAGWQQGDLQAYGPLPMLPSAQVLNYGQAAFEGMKAQRSHKDRIVVFRPDRNAERLHQGAERLIMPPVPKDMFIDAVTATVRANVDYVVVLPSTAAMPCSLSALAGVGCLLPQVPPLGKGSMYLRPLLMGTGPILGLGPAPSYTFAIYCAAVGAYFKSGQLTPIDLIVEERFHRAAPGGMGGTKAAGNYSPVLVTQLAAKKAGYSDVVYLDAKTDTYLEEVSSCNIFCVKGNTIKTPPLQGTILPGVTRRKQSTPVPSARGSHVASEGAATGLTTAAAGLWGPQGVPVQLPCLLLAPPLPLRSILELAAHRGYQVEEVPVSVHEAMEADELFTTGTAVVVCSVGSLTYQGRRREFTQQGQPGKVALEMYTSLTDIQAEKADDPFGWVVP